MTTWTVIRFLHLAAMALFVGGQLMLVVAVAPAVRGRGGDEETMRAVARRFGAASAVALATLVATGAAMASHYDLWDNSTLHVKLGVLLGVFLLTGVHVSMPGRRSISHVILVASLVIVWLGVRLAYG